MRLFFATPPGPLWHSPLRRAAWCLRINFELEEEQKLFYKKAANVAGYKELAPWIRMVLDRGQARGGEAGAG